MQMSLNKLQKALETDGPSLPPPIPPPIPPILQHKAEKPLTSERLINTLRDSDFIAFTSKTVLEGIARNFVRKEYPRGTLLADSNQTCRHFYVLERGEIEASFPDGTKQILSNEEGSSKFVAFCGASLLGHHGVCLKQKFVVDSPEGAVVLQIDSETYQAKSVEQIQAQTTNYIKFLQHVPILSKLTKEQLSENSALGNVVTKETFEDKQRIVKQGEIGHTFYIIMNGTVVCNQRTKKGVKEIIMKVNEWKTGDYFGEGALIQDAPRNADVVAVGHVECLTITREDFNEILGGLQHILEYNFRARVLNGVELLNNLTDAEKSEIAAELVSETFDDGEEIIRQGDHGDKFYIIKQGEVVFTRVEDENLEDVDLTGDLRTKGKEIGRLFVGQYFGEGALLTNAPRRASAYAIGKVLLLSLHRSVFDRVFDESLQEMLNRDFTKRRDLDKAGNDKLMEFKDLEQILVLGAGTYGQVLLVTHKVTGGTFALKCMKNSRIKKMKQEEHVKNEKEILAKIKHPFVVNLVQTFVGPDNVYALLEAVLGGELFALIRKAGRLKLKPAIFYIAQVILVFEYLHSLSIIYRDLKPENLLITEKGYLKVTDFGLAKQLEDSAKTYTLCGTPAYAAPEVYNLRGHGKSVDWWTLGVFTHELLAGMTPFAGDAEEIFSSLKAYSRAYPNIKLPKGLHGYAGDFVLRLLNPNPNRRLGSLSRGTGARDCKSHCLFKGYAWGKLLKGEIEAPYQPKIDSIYDTHNFYDPVLHDGQTRIDLDQLDPNEIHAGAPWEF